MNKVLPKKSVNGKDTQINVVSKDISGEVLAALCAGDQEAFKEVYLHYSTPLKNFLTRLIRDEENAKELTQDVFAKLWEKRSAVEPGKNIKGLLYTMAKNCAFNYLEHRKVVDKYHLFAQTLDGSDLSSDDIVIGRETELLIRIAVARMPAQRRRVFDMSKSEGLSNDQIATQLNISKNTVENHLAAAKKDLKGVLSAFVMLFMI